MTEQVRTEKLSALTPDEHNANVGTPRGVYMLDHSLRQYGAGRSILVDKHGRVIAGNKTLERAADIGLEDVIIVQTQGDQLVAVQRTDLDLETDEQARLLAYADNRASEVGLAWDPAVLAFDIDAGFNLEALFTEDELADGLAESLDPSAFLGVEKTAQPNPRDLPIDVIYTLRGADSTCCLAVQAGLRYGIQSGSYRLCPYTGKLSGRHAVTFVDNDYWDYKHEDHVEAVKAHAPKYATVRDFMTRPQCAAAGIAFYELEQVLAWAEELAEYAENVIVIPKADVLDLIPEQFILGYSVPTTHGGTPLPVEAFRGRRVHLLGGSWKAQLAHMAQLGEDVVSLDNNYVALIASRFGQFVDPEGNTCQVQKVAPRVNNVRYTALALSFGAMGAKVHQLMRAGSDDPANKIGAVAETRTTKQGDVSC